MYSSLPHLVLGFHGCDQSVADDIISSGLHQLQKSKNDYDWLGPGIYFWENNPVRALEYAKYLRDNPRRNRTAKPIKHPAVIGAIIDLGYCLNLLESRSIEVVKQGYQNLLRLQKLASAEFPKNPPDKSSKELLLSYLDCAVIRTVHYYKKQQGEKEYDTVRGMFVEGEPLYPNAGFHDKNHIQICVCNPDCIKGYFHPRKTTDEIVTR
ncbi:MAG: hypothetical protein WCL71_00755 [Deltaproteobacteria bacterium]